MVIQESAEDYLEKVLMLSKQKANVRQTDICDATGYARPSVSVAIRKLASEGYLEISVLGAITLTDKGRKLQEKAKDIPEKVGCCVDLPQDKGKALYQLLYELLEEMKAKER